MCHEPVSKVDFKVSARFERFALPMKPPNTSPEIDLRFAHEKYRSQHPQHHSHPPQNISPLQAVSLTFHAGRPGSGGAGHLSRETGALHRLRALFDLVLVTAAVDGHHLARALLHLISNCKMERKRRSIC